jgi:cobalamin biosynthesis protein CobD/CbiB
MGCWHHVWCFKSSWTTHNLPLKSCDCRVVIGHGWCTTWVLCCLPLSPNLVCCLVKTIIWLEGSAHPRFLKISLMEQFVSEILFCFTSSRRSSLEEMVGTLVGTQMTVSCTVFLYWFLSRCSMKYVWFSVLTALLLKIRVFWTWFDWQSHYSPSQSQ